MIKIERLDREQALRYMAYRGGELTDTAGAYLDECEQRLMKVLRPSFIYRVFGIRSFFPLCLDNGLVLPGNDISEHLAGCDRAAVFAVTIGLAVDTLIRRLQIEDMAKAVITDAFASTAAEQAADMAETAIRQDLPDQYFTWRYSPGYGDLPLDIQPLLLGAVEAGKRAGIAVQTGGLLSPLKSVTAIVGISDNRIEKQRMGCRDCMSYEVCQLRRKGLHCGSQKGT